jgi:TfoX/Sxy family transcriptional regulator of competence genes
MASSPKVGEGLSMPYDPGLAERLEEVLADHFNMEEKKMFGGIGWMLNGNMCVGIYKDWLVIRIGVEAAEKVLKEPNTKPMDITGKAMKGWAMIFPEGLEDDSDLNRFIQLAIDFVTTLPAK